MKRLLLLAGSAVGLAAAAAIWLQQLSAERTMRLLAAMSRRHAGLDRRTLRLPGGRGITYLEGGAGPPLVLLHGIGASKDHWVRLARYLTPHFRLVIPDLLGFGESDKPTSAGYGSAEQAAHLGAFLDALRLGPVHLGGSSMGGRVALLFAAAHPERVRSLWLLAPGGCTTCAPSGTVQRLARGEDVHLLARTPEEFDAAAAYAMASPPPVPDVVKHALTARTARHYALHARILQELYEECLVRSSEEIAARVKVPTHVVWGAEDRVLHPSGAETLRRALPTGSTTVLDAVGHLPMIEAPRRVAEDYLAFQRARALPWAA